MQLAYAFVADAAQVTPEGKISMLGGDFDTIRVQSFPAVHQALALVVRFNVTPDDCTRDHQLKIEWLGPLGALNSPPAAVKFRPQQTPQARADVPLKYLFVANLYGVGFDMPGKHTIRLSVDGKMSGSISLLVEQVNK